FIRELAEDDEGILKAVPRKSRASIRNGYKKFNLSVRHDMDLDLMYRLYSINKRNLGSPVYPKRFFEHLVYEFGEEAGMLSVYWEDKPVSSVLYFWFGDTVVPYFSGADKRYYRTNGNNVMYYELMKHAVRRGKRVFDFGRSRIGTGAADFKENMGFEPKPLHYYFYSPRETEVPDISPSNSSFSLAIELWSRLPVPIANLIGPQIVKLIP
ncbi:MAG: GNAT family N-acetyltransferase, partial [Chitinivibrionales bacterium]|nr:GNAT family N-acetyltransferase [Chitinivibrionales bacterium]MBD3355842.1 GNAT family N-acetyltransferase [Chitinivibrionales bacterium]